MRPFTRLWLNFPLAAPSGRCFCAPTRRSVAASRRACVVPLRTAKLDIGWGGADIAGRTSTWVCGQYARACARACASARRAAGVGEGE